LNEGARSRKVKRGGKGGETSGQEFFIAPGKQHLKEEGRSKLRVETGGLRCDTRDQKKSPKKKKKHPLPTEKKS